MKINIAVVAFLISVLVGLISATAQAAGPVQMRGVWQTTCHLDGKYYRLLEIEIHEDIWVVTDWLATDKYCNNIALEKQNMFQVVRDAQNSGWWNGKTLMVYFRPYLQVVADKFNQENLCGHQNWKHGRRIEITGKECKGFEVPKHEQMLFSIYKTEGPRNNILYLGMPSGISDGASEETRHREFSPLILIRDPASF